MQGNVPPAAECGGGGMWPDAEWGGSGEVPHIQPCRVAEVAACELPLRPANGAARDGAWRGCVLIPPSSLPLGPSQVPPGICVSLVDNLWTKCVGLTWALPWCVSAVHLLQCMMPFLKIWSSQVKLWARESV